MKIQVLGSGCPTCGKLNELVKQAVKDLALSTEVEYVTGAEGMQKIIELGAMSSPVLAIDNQLAMVGYTADLEAIKKLITKFTKQN